MRCVEARGRLTEHSLGLLPRQEARDVERHLEWCLGCRKESAELAEGSALVAMSLPTAEVPPSLEQGVVDRVVAAAGTAAPTPRPPSRPRIRALVAATLAAVMVAGGAVTWAVAERGRAANIQRIVTQESQDTIQRLRQLVESFGESALHADLSPILRARGSGRVLIYTSTGTEDFVLANVVVMEGGPRPYRIELTDRKGKVLSGGQLVLLDNGSLLFYETTGQDLSKATAVSVMDADGRALLGGVIERTADR